jgi:hypothetical protein
MTTDNLNSALDTSFNRYIAGGFESSGVSTTARMVASKRGCAAYLGDEEVCSKGDQFGRGVPKNGCLELRVK